jgi:hypothetical protein
MWSSVGVGLMTAGSRWLWLATGEKGIVLLLGAACLGVLKARVALDKTAKRIAERIERRGDGQCLGGFLSPVDWGIVVGMILLGRLLRTLTLPLLLLGLIYAAVGIGLLFSSRFIWRSLRKPREEVETSEEH